MIWFIVQEGDLAGSRSPFLSVVIQPQISENQCNHLSSVVRFLSLLSSETMLLAAIERLASLGYIHRGNLGIPEREAFFAPANDPPHHLYVCPPGSAEFRRHMVFRDYLRAHPKDAKIYGDLKIALAERFREDRPAYNSAKTKFVEELTKRALASQKLR